MQKRVCWKKVIYGKKKHTERRASMFEHIIEGKVAPLEYIHPEKRD